MSKTTIALLPIVLLPIVLMAVTATALVAPRVSLAQSSPVNVDVDSVDITTNDVLTVTVTVVEHSVSHLPEFPNIDGLTLVGSSRSFTRTYENGSFTTRAKFIYRFQPTRAGRIEIDPVTVRLDSGVYTSSPITITVTRAPIPPMPMAPRARDTLPRLPDLLGQNYFAEAEVDDETPYIGEQITHTFKFYSTDSLSRPTYRAPDFAGFWNAGERPETTDSATNSGRRYLVTEIDTILFPAVAGDTEIEPGLMIVPAGMFGSIRAEFRSDPVKLAVRPLPPNEPATFGGAVGRYDIAAGVDVKTTEIGDPVKLTVVVSGHGNFSALPEPIWTDAPGWRAYDGEVSTRASVSDGKLLGVKSYERVLIPEVAGVLETPSVEFSYFDPDLEEYVTVAADPISVFVEPGASGAASPLPTEGAADQSAITDIRHIKPAPGRLGARREALVSNPLYLTLWGLPLIAVGGLLGWRAAQRRRAAREAARGPARAREMALARLSSATSEDSIADVAALALHGYLSAALGRQTSGLPASEILSLVEDRGAAHETSAMLAQTLGILDEMRFAPPELERDASMARDVAEVVRRLGAEMRQ